MGTLLSQYVLRYLDDSKRLMATVRSPMLVWSKIPGQEDSEDLILATRVALHAKAPLVRDPLVFAVSKDLGKANPFGMGVTVGRNDNNDIVLDHSSMSRFHAYFQQDSHNPKAWKLVDAESKNGTWCGPLRLEPSKSQTLGERAELRFGDLELVYLMPQAFGEFLKQQ